MKEEKPKQYSARQYSEWYCKFMNWADETDCGNECHWKAPYGFVPEAGCPIHDK